VNAAMLFPEWVHDHCPPELTVPFSSHFGIGDINDGINTLLDAENRKF